MSDQRTGVPVSPGAGFSATDAAFEGFQILRRDPMSVLAWSLLMLVFSVAVAALMVAMGGQALTEMASQPTTLGQPPADPTRTLALMSRLAPVYLIVLLVSVALYGVIYAAVNRAVLRPGKSFGHFGLGLDEVLQVAALLLVWVILFAVYMVAVVLMVVAGMTAALAAKPLAVLAVVIGVPLVIAALLFFMVRLSLVSPMTLDRKRLVIGEAWRLTRGRFWPLLGAYALAGVVSFVLFIVVFSIVGAVAMTVGGATGMGAIMHPDMTSVGSYFGPVQIVNLIVSSSAYGLIFGVMLGAPASAYAQLSRGQRVADVFGPAVSDRSTSFGTAP